ncbi:MAG: hypothetical protein C6Y22_11665 [Hapalosiphonaceae cyanobacterium JJU2]|nr:MAG: hypothetical protein C6Y22_11665 [Hapalosiphonaceae cyanobacterium JJU2]
MKMRLIILGFSSINKKSTAKRPRTPRNKRLKILAQLHKETVLYLAPSPKLKFGLKAKVG